MTRTCTYVICIKIIYNNMYILPTCTYIGIVNMELRNGAKQRITRAHAPVKGTGIYI